MSIIGHFVQVTPQQLETLLSAPETITEILHTENNGGIDIDKAWHGIHFVLTGQQYGGAPPLANVICSPSTIGDEFGYGPARYLTAIDVASVAKALQILPPTEFAQRYDATALIENDIYPQGWENDEDLNYLMSWYDRLRNYYLDAASEGNAMIQYLT